MYTAACSQYSLFTQRSGHFGRTQGPLIPVLPASAAVPYTIDLLWMNWEHLYAVARFLLGGNDRKLQQQVKGRRCGFVIGRTRRLMFCSICLSSKTMRTLFTLTFLTLPSSGQEACKLHDLYILLWLIKYWILLIQNCVIALGSEVRSIGGTISVYGHSEFKLADKSEFW